MSTAGKVLVVLVSLSLMGWLVLLSMVAQRSANWGEVIAKQEDQLQALQGEAGAPGQVAQAEADLREVRAELVQEQLERNHDIQVLRAQVADQERALTDTIEALERVTNQVEGQETALKGAQLGRQRRQDELAETTQLLADTKQEVDQLMKRNEELVTQLDQLRIEFVTVLRENRRLVGSNAE